MAKPENVVLHSDLPREECLRRLVASTDAGERTIFSLSGYKGSKPLLLKVNGDQFVLWKRRYYRNDFSPYFFGTLSPDNQGTRLEGNFDMNRWVKIFMRFWIGFVILIALPLWSAALKGTIQGDPKVAVLVPIGMLLFGIFLPNVGRWIGRGEERFIKNFLETTLETRTAENQFTVSQRVIENRPL